MTPLRSLVLLAVLWLTGCASAPPPVDPPTEAGGWSRISLSDLPADTIPTPLQPLHPRKAWAATYRGPAAELRVEIFDFSHQQVAFEANQKYPKRAGEAVVYQGRHLIVVPPQGAAPGPVGEFLQAIQAALPRS